MRDKDTAPPATTAAAARIGLRWRAGAALALSLFVLGAPAPLHAGCDYPTIVHPSIAHGLESTLAARLSPMLPTSIPFEHHPQPCSGPTCSKRSPLPFSVPPDPVPVGPSEWAAHVLPPIWLNLPTHRLLPNSPATRPIRRATEVFHPPRRVLHTVQALFSISFISWRTPCLLDAPRSR